MAEQERLRDALGFNRIDNDTRGRLRELWPLIKQAMPGSLAGFYGHVTKWPELASLFASPESMNRAGRAQETHWERLFSGRFDADYDASVVRIAQVHNRIGLQPEPYIAGYLMVMEDIQAKLIAKHVGRWGANREELEKDIRAVDRAVMFDIQNVVATYLSEGKKEYERRLAQLADEFESSVTGIADRLSGSADSLRGGAESLLSAAQRTNEEAVNAASGAEQSSANMQSVASATEEMAASIAEINRQVSHTSRTADSAVEAVNKAETIVRGLNDAAMKIGEVVNLIQSIAGQTNLLALNATIEAARAGDAGKGFAVVAGEVKGLSGQTARATDDIAKQVAQIQTVAREVAGSMGEVSKTVESIREAAAAISGAVEEQGAVTQEISRSVAEAASGSSTVSHSVQEVKSVSATTSDNARLVTEAAGALSQEAAELKREAGEFIRRIRAADRRDESRQTVLLDASLEVGGVEVSGKLHDISAGGAQIRIDVSKLPAGDQGRLSVPATGRAVRARIVRRHVNTVNLEFTDRDLGERMAVEARAKTKG
ncbi:MAG: methyl-accepting chemotaxis protein [Magnetospirillum sp.]|nr:methyl-accepting chemotaxis protein [Magnetospirillum sp.]